MKTLFYKIFKRYKILETRFVTYYDGDKMVRESQGKSESEQWVIAKEEDTNTVLGMVYLCRRIRIIK